MTDPQFNLLGDVERLLETATNVDHYCEEKNCTPENPQCHEMHSQAALLKLREVLEPPHRSLQPKRLGNDAERIYADRWQQTNVRRSHINGGYTTLEYVICPDGQKHPGRATHRDSEVAACVIQWLGTSCGLGFVRGCEQAIDSARAQRSEWGPYTMLNIEPPAPDMAMAKLLAGSVTGHPAHGDLVRGICAAIAQARRDALKSALEQAIAK